MIQHGLLCYLFHHKVWMVCSLFLLTVFLTSCRKSGPTEPPPGPDTTSHAFIWRVDTIGAEGSYLYDVMIFNETCAYAVGTIFPRDSNGQSNQSDLYNAARWDGTMWTIIKVPYLFQGKATYGPIHTVFGFGPNDIWFGGGALEYWDGKKFSNDDAINSSWPAQWINKIWGSSDNDLYVVGDGGAAAHFDGSWHSIATGTTLPFQDIWGSRTTNGQQQVIAVASDKFGLGGKYICSLNGNTTTRISDSTNIGNRLSGIWFIPNQLYVLVGDEVYEKHLVTDPVWQDQPVSYQINEFKYAARANGANDLVVICENGTIAHYNGSTWRIYTELENSLDRLLNVSIKGNEIIAVGERYYDGVHNYGVIYHGTR